MTKHTPGPWKATDGANSHCFDGRIVNADDHCIAFVDLDTPDARLIAAAPGLKALALEIAAQDHMTGLGPQLETLINGWIDDARAAIKLIT